MCSWMSIRPGECLHPFEMQNNAMICCTRRRKVDCHCVCLFFIVFWSPLIGIIHQLCGCLCSDTRMVVDVRDSKEDWKWETAYPPPSTPTATTCCTILSVHPLISWWLVLLFVSTRCALSASYTSQVSWTRWCSMASLGHPVHCMAVGVSHRPRFLFVMLLSLTVWCFSIAFNH